ncbi:MAG: CPBP family intramembrane metalloprotease [Candidatus Eisenbacteria bacterium]|uniref:CPBP family intramembrane metalloprotease n=1 Tax=Eiseniibacteriota bacterium TaxID=2212470 RepID=A0A538SLH7_UNCEI|nr:MAG: CPBP family intramembrane metalloprotease [Candidatus Eisenbacteria bacterium]
MLGSLVAGFVLLAAGLAALAVRRRGSPLRTPQSTRRALLYALVYGLCWASFGRVLGGALLGIERSPWLLALGDVIFVTLGLYVWVMALAEGHDVRDHGFRTAKPAQVVLTLLMGLGPVALYSWGAYATLWHQRVNVTSDTLVFALLFASIGSALPDEMLFRGYMMSTLEGRTKRWARVALPALAFTVVRSLRMASALGLGSPAWLFYIFGVALPVGLWWGLMRELAGGTIVPCLLSHFLLEFGPSLAGASPAFP